MTLARALGSALAWLVVAGPDATAEPPGLAIEWDAPRSCPSNAKAMAWVEDHLGRTLVPPLGDGLTIRVRVRSRGSAWDVRLFVNDGERTRQRKLKPRRSCEEATKAAALIVAIAIDPEAEGRADPTEEPDVTEAPDSAEESDALGIVPEPEATGTAIAGEASRTDAATTDSATNSAATSSTDAREAEPDAREDTPPEPEPEEKEANERVPPPRNIPRRARVGRRRVSAPEGELGILGGVAWGFLLAASPEIGLRGAVLWPRAQLAFDTRYVFAREIERGRGRTEFSAWTLGAVAGPRFRFRTLELTPAAGLEAGVLLVRSFGYRNPRTLDGPWVTWRANVQLAWVPRPRFALTVGVEALGPLTRYAFQQGGEDVFTTPWVGVRGWLALALRFGTRPLQPRP